MNMPRLKATDEIHLTDRQKLVLHQLTRQQTAEQRLVVRAKILLLADENQSHSSIANRLHLKRATVIKWRRRWNEHTEKLKALAEESDEKRYTKQLMNPMGSAPRTGAPITFEAERVCQILVSLVNRRKGLMDP
jgi:transposase